MGIIGGGIMGVSVAAFLAEAGLSVGLIEGREIAAGASGRNSGVVQHPFDPVLAELHRESLDLYRELADDGAGFRLDDEPAGLLLLSPEAAAVSAAATAIAASAPELWPEVLAPAATRELEPLLASDLWACRLTTGYPVAPAAATHAMAVLAQRHGAVLLTGAAAESIVMKGGAAVGIRLADGTRIACGAVVVAAGHETPNFIPDWTGDEAPIRAVWGVVATVKMPDLARHVLEELGIDRPGRPPEQLFSLVTAGGSTSVGSTFLAERPDAMSRAPLVLEHARRFVPALGGLATASVRACARPVSFDGRPLVGPVGAARSLWVCSGHGPWGISTGPGSARRLADQLLGRRAVDEPLSPSRGVTG